MSLVTKVGDELHVTDDAAKLLAFIDMCEERGFRWHACQQTDGSYKLDVFIPQTGDVVTGKGASLVIAVSDLGQALIREGSRGLPKA